MSVINILSPHVADMIAAGEVVERPASVIKELMENAFDAGARNLTVEIKGGGATYIRVTDDGCGMAPEDAGIAFLRHATSKLKDAHGLESISTMGFRGEALAAISSVSRIELTTRQKGVPQGVRVIVEASDIVDMMECGCPEGTTMVIRDIFHNTPARLKFLKSDRSEAAACQLAALRCALGHPEVSVRYIRDGKEEFFSPGDSREESCVYSLLGRELASTLLPCKSDNLNIKMHGFVSAPAAARGNRSQQYFFCNGRFIKSQLLQTAVEQAYRNTLLTGRFPSCVIYLELGYGDVDVNVHPAKTEVKFTAERQVYDVVYYGVLSALSENRKPVEVELSSSTAKLVSSPDFYRTMTSTEFKNSGYSAAPVSSSPTHVSSPAPSSSSASAVSAVSPAVSLSKESAVKTEIQQEKPVSPPVTGQTWPLNPEPYAEQITIPLASPASISPVSSSPDNSSSQDIVVGGTIVENSVQNVENSVKLSFRFIGEVLRTYIVAEMNGEMLLIDKHAAHERIIFDRLRLQTSDISSQQLLMPVTIHPTSADADLLDSNGRLLSSLGFDIEPYGTSDFVVRGVPADMDIADIPAAIEEICTNLHSGKRIGAQDIRDEILHTVACKAAIKAGWDTQPEELDRLVESVVSGQVRYCPHGRPVAVTLSRRELDKLFKRCV